MTRTGFRRLTSLGDGSRHVVWGYDAVLESYWASADGAQADGLEISPDALVATVPALVRALVRSTGMEEADVFGALIGASPAPAPEASPADLT